MKKRFQTKPNRNLLTNYLKNVRSSLNSNLRNYDDFIPLGDFNVKLNDAVMKDLCQIYDCGNIIKEKTCCKNLQEPK